MRKSFFTKTETALTHSTLCSECGLHQKCSNPKMKGHGDCKEKVLVVTDMPTASDDYCGERLSGSSGTFILDAFDNCGMDFHRDCRIVSIMNCHTNDPKMNNAKCCFAAVQKEIIDYKPKVIFAMGDFATRQLVGSVWKRSFGEVKRWTGFTIPDARYDAWLCPIESPDEILSDERRPVRRIDFAKKIANGLDKLEVAPNALTVEQLTSAVKYTLDKDKASAYLRRVLKERPEYLAFDYETTGLKPFFDEQKIVTVSFASSDDFAVAFPFFEDATFQKLFHDVMRNDSKKIASNMKFENNWTSAKLGYVPKRWYWDTMIASHILDQRDGICSLKFQAFVNFGVPDYEGPMKSFLEADRANDLNRIEQCPKELLLRYNAIDSLLEYKLAMKQMKEMA